jgi:hypothetical protein
MNLVAALAQQRFHWGQTYEGSKDAMHFERLADKTLYRDSPPRPLEDLFLIH